MGWTVLYIAFGCVALWLLGEVLLQYKARLRWRLLAFTGFLGVVLGVLMPSVPVIFVGTAAFATGQLFVTLSFRRGFSTGWALGGKPGSSRRRRSDEEPPPARDSEPVLEVSQLEETATYQPLPLPDDTGQYGVYERDEADAYASMAGQPAAAPGQYSHRHEDYPQPDQPSAPPQDVYASAGYDTGSYATGPHDAGSYGTGPHDAGSYGTSYDAGTYGTSYDAGTYGTSYDTGNYDAGSYDTAAYSPSPYGVTDSGDTGSYGTGNYQDTYSSPLYAAANDQPYQDNYGYGGNDYRAYPDPYAAGGSAPQPPPAGPNDMYDPLSGDYQSEGGYPTPPSGTVGYGGYNNGQYPTAGYPPQTPPGGVWVPQQRDPDPGQPPPPYPPQNSGDYGYYDPQQRY